MPIKRTTVERFWAKVDTSGGPDACWPWTARLDCHGYGRLNITSRWVMAHRFSYELHVGPIPEGHQLDHLCRNRACQNAKHLEPVTLLENVRRGAAGAYLRARTHCPQGHPYSGENLRVEIGKYARRRCRICRSMEDARRYRTLVAEGMRE